MMHLVQFDLGSDPLQLIAQRELASHSIRGVGREGQHNDDNSGHNHHARMPKGTEYFGRPAVCKISFCGIRFHLSNRSLTKGSVSSISHSTCRYVRILSVNLLDLAESREEGVHDRWIEVASATVLDNVQRFI